MHGFDHAVFGPQTLGFKAKAVRPQVGLQGLHYADVYLMMCELNIIVIPSKEMDASDTRGIN